MRYSTGANEEKQSVFSSRNSNSGHSDSILINSVNDVAQMSNIIDDFCRSGIGGGEEEFPMLRCAKEEMHAVAKHNRDWFPGLKAR